MHDYLPYVDAQLAAWMRRFAATLPAHLADLGLQPDDVASTLDLIAEYDAAWTDQVAQTAAYHGAVARKNAARRAAVVAVRALVQEIRWQPGMTDGLLGLLGLPVYDRIRTRRGVGPEVPAMRLDTRPGMVVIHFGTNPSNENRNTKPAWAYGCNIERKLDGEAEFRMIAMSTASPHADLLPPGTGASYRAAYRGRRDRDIGAFCPMQHVIVGG